MNSPLSELKIALSPCPNDTFLSYAYLNGLVGTGLPPKVSFADIEQLNSWALKRQFPVIKLSIHAYGFVSSQYKLLPVGAALGEGVGPKLIASVPFAVEELPSKTVAVPGKQTTAHLLLEELTPQPLKKVFCAYHQIEDMIASGAVDCGLIIHESRFTFKRKGLVEIADLGDLWHEKHRCNLPLGGIAIDRDLSEEDTKKIIALLRESLTFALENPAAPKDFVTHHAQEKEWSINQQHIDLYVSQETFALTASGKKAISTLLGCGSDLGYYPHATQPVFAEDIE